MSPSSLFQEGEANPAAPIEQLAGGLAQGVVQCVIGLALGVLAAGLMRHVRVHWSWAVVALGLVLLLGSSLTGSSTTLAFTAACAAVLARRRQRRETEAGGDLVAGVHASSTPLDAARRLERVVVERGSAGSGVQRALRGGELALGRDQRGRGVTVPFGGKDGSHVLVVGATGSGKTVTQTWIAACAIEHGRAAIVVDPKGDEGMLGEIRHAAERAGRRLLRWTPRGGVVYNPYARGSETEIADKLLAGERFTEPHYLRQAQRYLGHVVRVLRARGGEVSLHAILEQLDPQALERLTRELPEGGGEATQAYLDSLTARQRGDLAGVRDRLAILAESDVGPWLDPRTPDAERFDLLGAVRARDVVYLDLEADSRPLVAEMLGAAIIQDLQTTVAALQGRPEPTLVVIDEFSAVAAEQVVRLFNRARSAGFSLLLGTQELADLRLPGRERLLEQVMGNLSVLVAHRQVVPRSAELIAEVAGTRAAWRVARHSDGRSTRTRSRESVLDRDQLMDLAPGWAAVIALGCGRPARIARIFSPGQDR
jgi:type IV secretory pathway TraG/TraD family ATPase VirD4